MNYYVRSLGMVILAIINLSNFNLNAAPAVGTQSFSGIGVSDDSPQVGRIGRTSAAAAGEVTIYPVLLVRPESIHFEGSFLEAVADIRNGTVKRSNPVLAFSTPRMYNYLAPGTKVPWWSVAYSETNGAPMFAGELNPTGDFANERGLTAAFIVRLRGTAVTLSSISRHEFNSNDGGVGVSRGYLFSEKEYSSPAYSSLARGYRGDDVIVSGPGSQECEDIFVLFWNFPFNGGGSQPGLNEIRDWTLSFDNFTEFFSVVVGGVSYLAQIEMKPESVLPSIAVVNGAVTLVNNAPGEVEKATSLGGPWVPAGFIQPGQPFVHTGEDVVFYRVKRDPWGF